MKHYELLGKAFGCSRNSKGFYMLPPYIRVIQVRESHSTYLSLITWKKTHYLEFGVSKCIFQYFAKINRAVVFLKWHFPGEVLPRIDYVRGDCAWYLKRSRICCFGPLKAAGGIIVVCMSDVWSVTFQMINDSIIAMLLKIDTLF